MTASSNQLARPEGHPNYVPVQPQRSAYNAAGSGFIGGVALDNYRRGLKTTMVSIESGNPLPRGDQLNRPRPTPASSLAEVPSWSGPYRTQTQQSISSPHLPQPASSLSPLATQPSKWSPSGSAGPSDPAKSAAQHGLEPQRGKKGLPFLKNPVSSLLMRRKPQQPPEDILPARIATQPGTASFDPRIKGTRVHDFGAPRAKKSSLRIDTGAGSPQFDQVPTECETSHALTTDHSSGYVQPAEEPAAIGSEDYSDPNVLQPSGDTQRLVYLRQEPPGSSDSKVSSNSSAKIRRSRNVSLSSVPKHMKSTSSRFSFVVGPAGQEQIMEEKHRQREMERQDSGTNERPDSRFDEFDDEDFDYDAMLNDDGEDDGFGGFDGLGLQNQTLDDGLYGDDATPLAEDVPYNHATNDATPLARGNPYADELEPQQELNATLDKENQDTLAQFVFSQPYPNSVGTSPQINDGLLPTPRDANGNIIGSALTKDTPTTVIFPVDAQTGQNPLSAGLANRFSGLGINEPLKVASPDIVGIQDSSRGSHLQTVSEDDMYFDEGIPGYETEFAEDLAAEPEYDTAPFDESLFDLDDTDQYGRPLPGVFAQAQSLHRLASDRTTKRESDQTGFSATSAPSRSTAHTSLSHGDVIEPQDSIDKRLEDGAAQSQAPNDSMEAYQAALAAATHQAAASGKFERSGSPTGDDGYYEDLEAYNNFEDDDGGFGYENMDDFELDDDGIIAEANATALANDSDGWYGQEFGFYSSPMSQGRKKKEPEYAYANGGFFGPKGLPDLARTASGRLVSREPNLTPITERSEYSNRNSIMSMGLPGFASGTPTTMQSPGLAQLAMLAEQGDEQMTLEALLRLRSKAWGGSQASLSSSKDGSPRSDRGEQPAAPWNATGHARQNSNFSNLSGNSRDSELGTSPSSPIVGSAYAAQSLSPQNMQPAKQMGNPLRGNSAPAAYRSAESRLAPSSVPEEEEYVESAPGSAMPGRSSNEWAWGQDGSTVNPSVIPTSRKGKGHRRHNSSADSISYIIEEEATGETRWVMERRRTSETGLVEILEREVVEGGRI